ncbi:hypothetical protein PV04_08217 [Phialophora macrospora]|uniref:Uncharacterized protein n=1 Tax=Phialophora macrospora TaxID=1851006 RepID=A0A0D2G1T6_9EURO|nr:hypothetical protein PV04_08217 [Phialophora macrospora]
MSSFFHSHSHHSSEHNSSHKHSSPEHQHGALYDSSLHSPLSHHHNHAASPTHHPSLHEPQVTHFGTQEPTYHDKMTTNSANMNNASNLQATVPQGQGATPDQGFANTALSTTNSQPTQSSSTRDNVPYTSTDPTTAPDASATRKITGDLKGMAQGVAGSVQAAMGTTFGQKSMADKGFEKMSEEDARLAAKSGKPPVGTEQRGKVLDAGQIGGAETRKGV